MSRLCCCCCWRATGVGSAEARRLRSRLERSSSESARAGSGLSVRPVARRGGGVKLILTTPARCEGTPQAVFQAAGSWFISRKQRGVTLGKCNSAAGGSGGLLLRGEVSTLYPVERGRGYRVEGRSKRGRVFRMRDTVEWHSTAYFLVSSPSCERDFAARPNGSPRRPARLASRVLSRETDACPSPRDCTIDCR